MHSFLDSKTMAKALRQGLSERNVALSHSDCLELVARQFGFANWNMLAARIDDAQLPKLVLPEGWFISHESNYYRIGLDPTSPGVVQIASMPGLENRDGLTGVLMQSVDASIYRGGKVRFSAQLRTEDADAGSIWLRVDPDEGKYLLFDNMLTRPTGGALRGTVEWTERAVILDVPDTAATIHFGLLLMGTGRLFARQVRFERADDASQVTARRRFLPQPTNLGFEPPRLQN